MWLLWHLLRPPQTTVACPKSHWKPDPAAQKALAPSHQGLSPPSHGREAQGQIDRPGQPCRPQKDLAERWGGKLDGPGTFLGISLSSLASLLGGQGPVELGGEIFHLASSLEQDGSPTSSPPTLRPQPDHTERIQERQSQIPFPALKLSTNKKPSHGRTLAM